MEKGKTRKSLTLKRQIQLIDEAEKFPAKKKKIIAEEFQVHPFMVTAVLKNKEKYRDDFQYLELKRSLSWTKICQKCMPCTLSIIVVRNFQSNQCSAQKPAAYI